MKHFLILFIFGFSLLAFNSDQNSIYSYTVESIDGKKVSLESYKGKVILVVNVASKCGYTPQYEDLQALYEKYNTKGLEILGFPSNDFMGQEPGSNEEISSFCKKNYGVTFPMFSKVQVKGKEMAPLYEFLTKQTLNGVSDSKVKWNFQKYLIDKNGHLVKHFSPGTNPLDQSLLTEIEGLLQD